MGLQTAHISYTPNNHFLFTYKLHAHHPMCLKFMTLPSILLLHGEEVSFKKEGVTLCVINVKVRGKMGSKKK